MGVPTWVYHKTEKPKIIDSEDAISLYDKGWRDSPIHFAEIKNFGIDPDDKVKVQHLGDSIQGVKDFANSAINIDGMGKDDLENFAKKHFGLDIDRRLSVKNIRVRIKGLIYGNSK